MGVLSLSKEGDVLAFKVTPNPFFVNINVDECNFVCFLLDSVSLQIGTYSNCLNACFFDQMIEMKAKCCAEKLKSRNFEKNRANGSS